VWYIIYSTTRSRSRSSKRRLVDDLGCVMCAARYDVKKNVVLDVVVLYIPVLYSVWCFDIRNSQFDMMGIGRSTGGSALFLTTFAACSIHTSTARNRSKEEAPHASFQFGE
jgi:hypothetical protein